MEGEKMNTTTATLPNGEKVTRKSKTRTPEYIVAIKGRNDGQWQEWGVLSWCGSHELASKAAAKNAAYWDQMEIIAVD